MSSMKKKADRKVTKKLEPYLYLLPVFALFGVFTFYPLIRTVVMSLSSVNSMGEIVKFAGLKNFHTLFRAEQFWKSFRTTFVFAACLVPLELLIGVTLGLLADNRKKKTSPIRTIFALPMSISYACGAMIWLMMFNPTAGLINSVIGKPISWSGDRIHAMLMIIITTCWLTAGMNFIYVLSGLQSVPDELYECSRLEGAGYLQTVRHITLPCISPTLFFLLVINPVNAFQIFTQVKLMTKGGPGGSTSVMAYSIYESAFVSNRWGYASAQSIVFFVILLIISIIQFKAEKKGVFYQ